MRLAEFFDSMARNLGLTGMVTLAKDSNDSVYIVAPIHIAETPGLGEN